MNRFINSWLTWLETHWVAPAYSGGVLLGLTIAFFGAGVNTLSGWLYAISGGLLAIAIVSIWSAPRSLQGIRAYRAPIRPINAGEQLTVEITLENTTAQSKVLMQVRDGVPATFEPLPETAIATLAARKSHRWVYTCHPPRRGIYHWQHIALRTAAPLGLFWCQRPLTVPAQATVYPKVFPLTRCPLIDHLGLATGLRWQRTQQAHAASEGLTRALRPYRWGDPTRLIHWRTSARYGELRVREQEDLTADNQVLIGLDTRDRWSEAAFESAVVAAATLYIYSLRQQLTVALWLPDAGILRTKHTVLSALAEVMPRQSAARDRVPNLPLLWLSTSPPERLLPPDSQWLQWHDTPSTRPSTIAPRLIIDPTESLMTQLQSELRTAAN